MTRTRSRESRSEESLDTSQKTLLWRQFGGAIDMLENAITACPEALWGDRTRQPQYWYLAYHTLFWLDLYLSPSAEGFAPPAPYTLSELDPEGAMPDRAYTQAEMLGYLESCREKCRSTIASMSAAQAESDFEGFDWAGFSRAELLLYNMRHVQHHAAQMNLLLRLATASAPRWVRRAGQPLQPA